ncbi:polyisoprenoid-binding protein YceI [Silvibacterium bohemicum]|uniref:Polyisoprenoid-binding protein YceI n=1 Tax=Silvibacterium bohemicum TaxID=1577686 RepID=A0A841JP08_9BACT|nr:YceI family protein [Silvibacterium bohemicum]MBB6142327.1 polyisoprenoid-binding protein YceI [Silvibacterium bohemicum]
MKARRTILKSPRRTILRSIGGLLSLALCIGASAQTAPQDGQKVTVHLDPATTQIHWTLSDPLHTVHGAFALKGGLVTFDPQTGMAQGEILVDVISGQSGSHARDSRMQKDVLESEKFPQAIFHPEKVTGSIHSGSKQSVTVSGTFTIHGSDHPLALAMQVEIAGKNATATTHFVIPYVAWGMKDPSSFVLHVGKQVDVDVAAKGTVEGLQ